MDITIFSICWNEEIILPFFFKHYKERFPKAKFVIYDNMSTDKSREIIKNHGGEIRNYETNNEVRDDKYLEIKNNVWKKSDSDWVIVCDIDEFADINENIIEKTNATIFKTEGYEMIGNTLNLDNLTTGTRNEFLDKCLIFNKKYIKEINFDAGAHSCKPEGKIIFAKNRITLKHMKYFNLQFVIDRFKNYATRLSKINTENGWGLHYLQKEESIKNSYNFLKKNQTSVPYSLFHYYGNKNLILRRFLLKFNLIPKSVFKG